MPQLTIANRKFNSRLFLGTGKFGSVRQMEEAVLASGSEMVTVALKRIDMETPTDSILSHLQYPHIQLLPNTSGVRTAEEAIFAAYFTEGKNIDDAATLSQIGTQLGMDPDEIRAVLATGQYANDVDADVYEAHQSGIRGVPFFVLDRKYAISGAQPDDVFDESISVGYEEWKKQPAP